MINNFYFFAIFLAHAERQAINTIIQGSAADVTKIAMIKVDKNVNQSFPKTPVKLVMHLHDELIFEVIQFLFLYNDIFSKSKVRVY